MIDDAAVSADKPKHAYTVCEAQDAVCPWCQGRMRLEDEDARDGSVFECPCCDREIRLRVQTDVTVYLHPSHHD